MMFDTDEMTARQLDEQDPLASMGEEFLVPIGKSGPKIYFCGNSLGLQPRGARGALVQELQDWAELGVDGHFHASRPWYGYDEDLRAPMARVVGALPDEVVAMNALTVNLHLLMVSFYRPTAGRYKILVEAGAFPSDRYAVASQAAFHGFDPADAIIEVETRPGSWCLSTEDIVEVLQTRGEEIALVLLGGVNYYTGQVLDMETITRVGHSVGWVVGFDLAHAAGNVIVALHDWGVDFASWCSYKYLNAGPGSVSGVFVHQKHGGRVDLPRFAGWWGNDPETRFDMPDRFVPQFGAAGWQLSNAPVFSMAVFRVSMNLYSTVGMEALREKSRKMSAYLFALMDEIPGDRFQIITPTDPEARGCQVSIYVGEGAQGFFARLQEADVVCDFRKPNVIRLAPVPLYNGFAEIWKFWQVLQRSVA